MYIYNKWIASCYNEKVKKEDSFDMKPLEADSDEEMDLPSEEPSNKVECKVWILSLQVIVYTFIYSACLDVVVSLKVLPAKLKYKDSYTSN